MFLHFLGISLNVIFGDLQELLIHLAWEQIEWQIATKASTDILRAEFN